MKALRHIRAVGTSCVIALVVALVVFGLTSMVTKSQTLKLSLTAGSGFTITSNIYNSPACSGATALLYPGTTRCLVFSVKDNLTVPITVQSLSMTLDPSFPPPPSGCSAADLSLPSYSGSFNVPASTSANSPGLPILLKDTGTNQDNCENTTLHFAYTGSAQYTDATTTVLTSSLNPSTYSQSVTFSAAVTGANAGNDPSTPTGTVTFYSCSTAACTTTTSLSSGALPANDIATYTTTSLPAGSDYIEAVYGGSGTNYLGSTSNVLTQNVAQQGTIVTANPTILYLQLNLLTLQVNVTLGPLSATLTSASGVPIAGQTLIFAANPSLGTPVLCTAVTNAQGYATCNSQLTGLLTSTLNGGIKVTFAGSSNYIPSSGSAGLATVNLASIL